jgi:hypothetical protein
LWHGTHDGNRLGYGLSLRDCDCLHWHGDWLRNWSGLRSRDSLRNGSRHRRCNRLWRHSDWSRLRNGNSGARHCDRLRWGAQRLLGCNDERTDGIRIHRFRKHRCSGHLLFVVAEVVAADESGAHLREERLQFSTQRDAVGGLHHHVGDQQIHTS